LIDKADNEANTFLSAKSISVNPFKPTKGERPTELTNMNKNPNKDIPDDFSQS